MLNLRFNKKYFLLFVLLFLLELYIGFYVHDRIIRPYIGDLLVVILIYAFVMTFVDISYKKAAFFTFLFACAIEFAQYLNIVTLLGLENNSFARVIIGTSFSWIDILAYFGGYLVILLGEMVITKRKV